MSATTTSPHSVRPGKSRWPGFLREKVTVSAARTAISPMSAPLSPETPLGTSTAATARPPALTASTAARAAPSSGRDRPAPNKASMTSSAPPNRPGTAASSRASTAPSQRPAWCAASPLSRSRAPSRARRTDQPAAARWRAATKPSPPLLPGPQSTTTGHGRWRARTASATAQPAFSMSATPGTPCSAAALSARYISATLKTADMATGPLPWLRRPG